MDFVTLDATTTPPAEIALRLLAASAFGFVLGVDRESRHKPAGLRTHMLVCVAAAAFTLLAFELTVMWLQIPHGAAFDSVDLPPDFDAGNLRPDPLRLMEAIVAGLGFLGGGAIFTSRGDVQGLTTGAGIWTAGAVGLAAGAGFYLLAASVTLLSVFIITVLGYAKRSLERKLGRRS